MPIEVYPAGKCYCPELRKEIDQNKCAGCACYLGHNINGSGKDAVFFVICSFSLAD